MVRTNAVNTNDLSAQLNKEKKFQMLKKLKEEKEKKRDVVVRNV
jgi:aminoglycoside phosphotransferase